MTITVVANDIHDARHKLGFKDSNAPIQIRWRTNEYDRKHEMGCIVDARALFPIVRVPVEFKTVREAMKYISKLLLEHESFAAKQIAEYKAAEREAAKKAAKKP